MHPFIQAEAAFHRVLVAPESPQFGSVRGAPRCAKQVEILWGQWVDSNALGRVVLKGFEDSRIRTCVVSELD